MDAWEASRHRMFVGDTPGHVRTVSNSRPQGGVRGAQGSYFSQTGATKKAANGGAVDRLEVDRGITSAC